MSKFPLCLSLASVLLFSACQKNQISVDSLQNSSGTTVRSAIPTALEFSTADVQKSTKYLFADDEAESVSFDAKQRSFLTTAPLQVRLDEEALHIKFYSPRPLKNVIIGVKLENTLRPIPIIRFEEIPAFADLRVGVNEESWEKIITHIEQYLKVGDLKRSDVLLEVESDDPYYATLKKINVQWNVSFSAYSRDGYWARVIRPIHMKEAVALALNMTYMFSTERFKDSLVNAWKGALWGNNGKDDIIDNEKLLINVKANRNIRFGHTTGVYGLGGGSVLGLNEKIYLEHYADDVSDSNTAFHEFGHCLGYNDGPSNMAYGPWSEKFCLKMYEDMSRIKELPVYSRNFLKSRSNTNLHWSAYNKAPKSKFVID